MILRFLGDGKHWRRRTVNDELMSIMNASMCLMYVVERGCLLLEIDLWDCPTYKSSWVVIERSSNRVNLLTAYIMYHSIGDHDKPSFGQARKESGVVLGKTKRSEYLRGHKMHIS